MLYMFHICVAVTKYPSVKCVHIKNIKNEFTFQVILNRSVPVVFANYSLVEDMQSVSRMAAIRSSESLLFVVGNKVCTFILYSSKAQQPSAEN